MDRIPASERTREKLRALMDGRSQVEEERSELVRLAARLIIEEALEGEARDALGRDYYARGGQPGAGYRYGYRRGRVPSAEGAPSSTVRRRSPIGRSHSARAFGKLSGDAPNSWRAWRWRCMPAGCRRATLRRCLPVRMAAAC